MGKEMTDEEVTAVLPDEEPRSLRLVFRGHSTAAGPTFKCECAFCHACRALAPEIEAREEAEDQLQVTSDKLEKAEAKLAIATSSLNRIWDGNGKPGVLWAGLHAKAALEKMRFVERGFYHLASDT